MIYDSDAAAMHMEIESSFEVLEELVDRAQAFFGAHVGNEDVLYRIVLLASEAATNAIEHGNHLDPSLKVQVWFKVRDGRASVVVEDEGGGFKPDQVADPLTSDHLLQDRGRGVFLMNELADEVTWENDGRRVTILIDLPPA